MKSTQRTIVRIGLGLAAMAAGAVLFWPKPAPPFSPEKALAFCTAICLWLFAEIFAEPRASESASLSVHDMNLAGDVLKLGNDDLIVFLDKHDFGGSFRQEQIEPVHALCYFLLRPSSIFSDKQLQKQLAAVSKQACEFSRMIAEGASEKSGRDDIFTMVHQFEPNGQWSDETILKVEAANKKADELSAALKLLQKALLSRNFPVGVVTGA